MKTLLMVCLLFSSTVALADGCKLLSVKERFATERIFAEGTQYTDENIKLQVMGYGLNKKVLTLKITTIAKDTYVNVWTYRTGYNEHTNESWHLPVYENLQDSFDNSLTLLPKWKISINSQLTLDYGKSIQLSYTLKDKPLPGANYFRLLINHNWGACRKAELVLPASFFHGAAK